MSHILTILKVFWLRKKLNLLMRAKNIALDLDRDRTPTITWKDHLLYWWSKYVCCGFLKSHFRANLNNRFMLKLFLIYKQLTTSGTFANSIATAVVGFIGGIILTYFYFIFSTVILDLSIPVIFYGSVGLCLFLTIGLAFISTVRSVVLSILPEICTRKARSMLISYGLLLLITGPGSNILYNSMQLTETITCTRDQLEAVNRNLTELYLKPLRALRNGIEKLLSSIKPVVQTIKSGIVNIKDAIVFLAQTIKRAFQWLGGITSICNNKIGTPYELCHKMFERVIQDCQVKVSYPFNLLCKIGIIVENVCSVLKVVDYFCQFISFIKSSTLDFVQNKVKDIIRFIKTMFYVSVSFHHSFAFSTNQSQSVKDIIKKVFHAEEKRLNFFLGILNFMKFIIGAFIGYVLFSAFVYRQRFLHNLHYDNYHINKYIIELDTRRASVNRQTLFPLTSGEKMKYVSLFSLRMTVKERLRFLRDSFFLVSSATKIFFLLLIDVALHWVLTLINTYGKLHFYFGNNKAIVQAEGSGLWWTIYTFINKLLKPFDLEFRFNSEPCLPTPIPPSYIIYERIAIIMAFAWLTVLFEPFGLRFRNYVMSNYYPDAARRRAVWLYNYLLQMRGNLSTYIRRQLLRKISFGIRTDKPNLRKFLLTRFPRLKYILPYKEIYKECMVCGYTNPTVKCLTPDCPGTYCKDCFEQLNNKCMICNMPQDLETNDISEEEDSDDEMEDQTLTEHKPWWKFWFLADRQKDETISLRDMENAKSEYFSFENELRRRTKRTSLDSKLKDYFDESWRRNDWAFEEDFLIPMPNFNSWIRPKFRDTNNEQLFLK